MFAIIKMCERPMGFAPMFDHRYSAGNGSSCCLCWVQGETWRIEILLISIDYRSRVEPWSESSNNPFDRARSRRLIIYAMALIDIWMKVARLSHPFSFPEHLADVRLDIYSNGFFSFHAWSTKVNAQICMMAIKYFPERIDWLQFRSIVRAPSLGSNW